MFANGPRELIAPFPHLKVLDFQRSRFHSVLSEELSQLTDKIVSHLVLVMVTSLLKFILDRAILRVDRDFRSESQLVHAA